METSHSVREMQAVEEEHNSDGDEEEKGFVDDAKRFETNLEKYTQDLAALIGSPNFQEMLKDVINKEKDITGQKYDVLINSLRQEMRGLSDARARDAAEIKLLQTQVETLRKGADLDRGGKTGNGNGNDVEAIKNQLWVVDSEILSLKSHIGGGERVVNKKRVSGSLSGNSTARNGNGAAEAGQEMEAMIDKLRGQFTQLRQDLLANFDEKAKAMRRIEAENQLLKSGKPVIVQESSNAELEKELDMLREEASNHAKERQALITILDMKIRALVDGIGRSTAELAPELLKNPKFAREFHALEKLVAATVTAMQADDDGKEEDGKS
ncbi:hypothetical protein CBR_g41135 [Chara braunii]|uniref:Uncharacterized protein n=1 Tax=Chara braunii TaxID=69332 RepID=A0A388LV82_CHABU|nr:hypothetical protein CBR_g41135 [Chara braunii]|eukprot:GBG86230.1 hypothetical protein CBR_g41135 [Chara braunii]